MAVKKKSTKKTAIKKVVAKKVAKKKAATKKRATKKSAPSPVGRPTKYKEEYSGVAYKLCLLGHTDAELASFFEVDEATINRWKEKYPEFCESLNKGKDFADAEVAYSLFQRATGYEHEEDDIRAIAGEVVITPTVKHYPPDSTALAYWLNNRSRGKFRQRQEVDLTKTTKIEELSDEELDEYIDSRSQ